MIHVQKGMDYLKEAALQYASYRLQTSVLYIGAEDEEYLSRLAHKGCSLLSFIYRPHGELKGHQYRFHSKADLLIQLGERLLDHEFDSILLMKGSEFLGEDLSDFMRTILIRLNRGGCLLVLDRLMPELREDYTALIEYNDQGEALYLIADYLTDQSLPHCVVRVKMEKMLSEAPRFSLGLAGDIIRREDLFDLSVSMLDAFRNAPDYEGESLFEIQEELRNVMNGRYGSWLPEASLCIRRQHEIASALMVSLYRSQPLITFVFTRPAYQHQGYARRLIEASALSLKNRGYRKFYAFYRLGNDTSRSLLDRLGFIEAGRSIE